MIPAHIRTIIFDLDGTLYEDVRVYERYVRELSAFVPSSERDGFLSAWELAREGRGPARVGMGYDGDRDLLFRWSEGSITSYVDWSGNHLPVPDPQPRTESAPEKTPVEVPFFGTGRVSIGDWWALPSALARHFGVSVEGRQRAFMATREAMQDDLRLKEEPWLRHLLQDLRGNNMTLIAMSNSPSDSVIDVLEWLGIAECFDEVIPSAVKPRGLITFLEGTCAEDILSVGDNYVNEIEPVLKAGGSALYIDRHHTGLGSAHPHCYRIESRDAMREWLVHGAP
ncbi:MAG: hypothetical protein NVSMB52_00100 [Chloroflexota bacterium]